MNPSNWYAWLDLMPPKPDELHVVGDVEVGNPGVQAELQERVPQGINPAILQLELHLMQRPGVWPQMISSAQCRYDRVIRPGMPAYTHVEIFRGGAQIALIDIDIVR